MPKKSTKSKSKRLTLRQKHKILKKVKEHHRKKRKEERKKSTTKASKKEPFGKDPGIPSQWPFKDELIKEMAWKKSQILLEEKNKKEERKRTRQQAEPTGMEAEESDLTRLAALKDAAAKKQTEFEDRKKIKGTGGVNADADKTRRAFYKEYKRVAEAADVIIQVLDARDPLACRCTDIEKHIRSINPNKRVLLLLNKIDLVPRDVVEKWLKYLREELPTVAFKCSTQEQASNISQKPSRGRGAGAAKKQNTGSGDAKAGAGAVGSGCLGADTLLQLLKNYTRNAGIKTSITVGVVGLPNVGKSSLINSLKRTRVAQVGNTPGVTRSVQEVQLDKNIKLLDSPGVVFSNAESDAVAALRNAIKVESLPDPVTPVTEILKRVPAKQLMVVYKVPAFKDTDHFLQLIAAARGKLKKGGTPDCPAAARIVLQDWNSGRIPFYTLPPARADTRLDGALVVQQWAKEFDADEVFADEQRVLVEHLPSTDESGPSGAPFFEAQSLGGVSMQMEQEKEGGEESDSEDAMDEGDEAPVPRKLASQPGAQQASLLYSESGQFNPHAARAEKKRQKKLKAAGMPSEDDSDFDFEEANEEFGYKELNGTKKGEGSEEESEEDEDEDEWEEGDEDEDEDDVDGMEG